MTLKKSGWIAVLAIGLLAGCGQPAQIQNTPNSNTIANATANATVNGAASTDAASNNVAQGATAMLALTSTMGDAITSADAAKVTATGLKLEEAWHGFEDNVHAKYPSDYAAIEKYLDPLEAGAKASPPDKTTLTQLNQQLSQALQNLQKKLS